MRTIQEIEADIQAKEAELADNQRKLEEAEETVKRATRRIRELDRRSYGRSELKALDYELEAAKHAALIAGKPVAVWAPGTHYWQDCVIVSVSDGYIAVCGIDSSQVVEFRRTDGRPKGSRGTWHDTLDVPACLAAWNKYQNTLTSEVV